MQQDFTLTPFLRFYSDPILLNELFGNNEMRRINSGKYLLHTACLLLVSHASIGADSISPTEPATCQSILVDFSSPEVTLISAEMVSADRGIPAHCRVFGTTTIDIGFDVRLPTDWNGRFYMVGNEGSGGKFNTRYMNRALRLNYATASTDQGYDGAVEGDAYGYNNRQKVIDYAFRATHRTAQVSKEIIAAWYGAPAAYSYFVAGSAGGRQALMEAQRFPHDFDGILLSAPVYNISKIHMWGIWKAKAMTGAGHVDPEKVSVISKAVYDLCDDDDGVLDGVISDPPSCGFDPNKDLQICDGISDSASCFTPAQIEALNLIYDGVRNSKGELLFPGQPVGAEAIGDMPPWMAADGPQSAWYDWVVVPAGETPRFVGFAESFLRYTAFEIDDPDYDWRRFDFDDDPARMSIASSIVDADNPDLRPFRASGGKMIHYHHWADTAVPATNSIDYFERVQEVSGSTDDFYRLYLVPGGFHGSPGVGATEVPWLDLIVNWVEKGIAPGELIAIRTENGEVKFTRRICPHPFKATYDGKGDPATSDSFSCTR